SDLPLDALPKPEGACLAVAPYARLWSMFPEVDGDCPPAVPYPYGRLWPVGALPDPAGNCPAAAPPYVLPETLPAEPKGAFLELDGDCLIASPPIAFPWLPYVSPWPGDASIGSNER